MNGTAREGNISSSDRWFVQINSIWEMSGKQTVKESKNQASGLPRRDVLKGTAAVALVFSAFAHLSMNSADAAESAGSLFDTKEILDESTLEIKILQDWHPVGATRQKLIEINASARVPTDSDFNHWRTTCRTFCGGWHCHRAFGTGR